MLPLKHTRTYWNCSQKSQCLVFEILKGAIAEAQSSFYHVLLVPNLISGGV
jgi:hypothetical protein